jgi:hypothetical protein
MSSQRNRSVATESTTVEEPLSRLFRPLGPPAPWTWKTWASLMALVIFWAWRAHATWAAWGNLTIDSGHEMYIPALLAQGKLLYRDIWYMYGPAAPYFNSYLFRLFGPRLDVLYWAGCLSALGSAIFLYLTGLRISAPVLGWTAGAVVVMQAFQPSLFCFPLPYSFAAVYGCLLGCLFLWLVINASASRNWIWMLASGTTACIALLVKPEFGTACYGALVILIATRVFVLRSWRMLAKDLGALLPGVVVCVLVILWMVSIGGVEFMTQENILSWPTSYFMKTFGKMWLERNGLILTGPAFAEAFFQTIPLLAALLVSYCLLWWHRSDKRAIYLKGVVFLIVAVYFVRFTEFDTSWAKTSEHFLSKIFFPGDMVLYIILAAFAVWALFWRRPSAVPAQSPAFPILLTFSSLLSFRILMGNEAEGYPIYYNGPVVLSFLWLLSLMIPRSGRSRFFVRAGELGICALCMTAVVIHVLPLEASARDFVPMNTDRGMIRVSDNLAENYSAAIQFMKDKAAQGDSVLSIPEDTSLYFLSGTYCPTRVFSFTPGVLAPGRMTEDTIREIDKKPVRYLLWSNRTFSEFGVPFFGKDFDREVGDYLKSHYRKVGPIIPFTGSFWDWTAVVWERKSDEEIKQLH